MKGNIIKKLLENSRYMVIIAVIGSFLGSLTLFFLAGGKVISILASAFMEPTVSGPGLKALSLSFIEALDLFLIGTVFYLIAMGLYELFIDDTLEIPAWLAIHDLDELKEMLVRIIILVLAVLYLGHLITWDGQKDLLGLGVSIAVVIAALSYFLNQKKGKNP